MLQQIRWYFNANVDMFRMRLIVTPRKLPDILNNKQKNHSPVLFSLKYTQSVTEHGKNERIHTTYKMSAENQGRWKPCPDYFSRNNHQQDRGILSSRYRFIILQVFSFVHLFTITFLLSVHLLLRLMHCIRYCSETFRFIFVFPAFLLANVYGISMILL